MLNAITTTELPEHSLTVEISTFRGVYGIRAQSAKTAASQWGEYLQQRMGVLDNDTPVEVELGPVLKLLTLGASVPVEVTLTDTTDVDTVLTVSKALVVDDPKFKKLAIKFTPTTEVPACRFWIDWIAAKT